MSTKTKLPLGQPTVYPSSYSAEHLVAIQRQEGRTILGINERALPFQGVDLWTAFELSWLTPTGVPTAAVAQLTIPCDSPCLVESKSLKLYFNSFNQAVFINLATVIDTITCDLSAVIGASVDVQIDCLPLTQTPAWHSELPGICLDTLAVNVSEYQPNRSFLMIDKADALVSEQLYSHLLKSNCPVTGQPDWASLQIDYRGRPICREGLLKYIISFREHTDFHEHCVERIFMDIMQCCHPQALTVYARYTRRGGIDINPYRSTNYTQPDHIVRTWRQ